MAYTSGEASTILDVVEAINTMLVTTLGWTAKYTKNCTYDSKNRLCEAIYEGKGDGNDKIYLQIRVPTHYDSSISAETPNSVNNMYLDSMAGYDTKLEYYEQPGSIQQWLKSYGVTEVNQPMFTVTENEKFYYWIFADTYRLIVVARMSIVYESMYIGFINPISSERQYPYPMYVAGNSSVSNGSWPTNSPGSFIFPSSNTGFLRRADGVWRAFSAYGDASTDPSPTTDGTVFPYNCGSRLLVPNYIGTQSMNQDNFLMIPVMLQTNNPIDINGILRGVYWISGTRDVATEQILTYNLESYIVFDTKQERGANTYFAVKLE